MQARATRREAPPQIAYYRSLSPEQQREYKRALGRRVLSEDQRVLEMLAAYDREEVAVSAGA
jgi:hypothetical protein